MDKKELKIAFFGVKSWEREIIEKEINRLPAYGIGIFEGEVHDNIETAAKYDIISPFIYSKMDREVLNKLPNLKMVATRSTGIQPRRPPSAVALRRSSCRAPVISLGLASAS